MIHGGQPMWNVVDITIEFFEKIDPAAAHGFHAVVFSR